jgi:hypothetical protein
MATTQNDLRFRIDNVRAAFTDSLLKPEQFNGEGKFRCGCSLLLDPEHPQLASVKKAIEQAMTDKWGKDPKVLAANKKSAESKDKICLRDGDLKPKYAGFPGNVYLSANCKGGDTEAEATRPTVYDAARNKITEPSKSPIYSGCYVNALVEFYADDRFGAAVNCTLVGIQFRKDGDAFGSAPAREDDFEDVTEGASADDFA